MLSKYLEQQQERLNKMQQAQQHLAQHAERENQRLKALQQHQQSLASATQMESSLALQNLAGIKHILQHLEQEQVQKQQIAQEDLQRQQTSCRKQAAFNLGVEQVIEKKNLQQAYKKYRQQQKVEDEIANQFVLRSK